MKAQTLTVFLKIFSRPVFFNLFYYSSKICLYAMNRTSASVLAPEFSGEKLAFEWVLRKLNKKDELIIFDCGGNEGSYTSLLLNELNKEKQRATIHVFEPSHLNNNILAERFQGNSRVVVHQAGVSNENGTATLYYPWDGSTGASLAKSVSSIHIASPHKVESEEVALVTIDSFCTENAVDHIDFLKLDIEGYELNALKGAANMIENKKISYMQIEIGDASLATRSTLYDFWIMLNTSYNFYLILNQGLMPIQYKPDLECFLGASNFIFELRD